MIIKKDGGQHDKFCPPLFIAYPKSKTFYFTAAIALS